MFFSPVQLKQQKKLQYIYYNVFTIDFPERLGLSPELCKKISENIYEMDGFGGFFVFCNIEYDLLMV